MRDVLVAGIGMTKFAKQLDRSLKDLVSDAVLRALADAQLGVNTIQAAYFANAVAGSMTGQEMVAGQVSLAPLGLHEIPVFNVENACASGASAFHLAWLAVASGLHDVVLAVGAEKLSHVDKKRSFAAIARAMDVENVRAVANEDRSPFMDLYAAKARGYMKTTGATVEDFAAVVVKNQFHGSLNADAQYGREVSVREVLASRQIVWPLSLLMCSPISDGAAATVLVARGSRTDLRRFVRIAASVIASGVGPQGGRTTAVTRASEKAYEMAGVGPSDLDCAEIHDAAAPAELSLYEELGLVRVGDGPALIRDGSTRLGGPLPVNTSGGLLARGHPIGATGLAQICEAIQQVRGEAAKRQVDGARIALTQNAGGWSGNDVAAAAVHILIRDRPST